MSEFLALALLVLLASYGGRWIERRRRAPGWTGLLPQWAWPVLTVAWSLALGGLAYWGLSLWLEWSVQMLTR